MENTNKTVKRFLEYVAFATSSDDTSESVPSTKNQFALANHIAEEMREIGLSDVFVDEKCYVYGTIPKNAENDSVIGFIAHIDTSGDFSGENILPQFIEYSGGDIILNEQKGIVMSQEDFPLLSKYIGQTLITTDGTTLLGADDKAGIAEIMTAAEEIINSGCAHGTIKIAFTPDEEIGRGAEHFDVEGFGCDYAYTVDGGELGEIEYENFNAASLTVKIQGANIHPGTAKNKMVNSVQLAFEYNSLLPASQRPEHTEKYEGFFHLNNIKGDVEHAEMHYIIRDHDKALFEKKKALAISAADFLNAKYMKNPVAVTITDSYYNMKEKILPHMHIIDKIASAMTENGVEPKIVPIRGGTDGARLSYMGLPCPNICTGGENFHGKYEFVSVQSMVKVKDILKTLMQNG